jgi:hypothetical protein
VRQAVVYLVAQVALLEVLLEALVELLVGLLVQVGC